MSDATLNELRQRLTRMESRVCRIADFLGAQVGSPSKALVLIGTTDTEVHVETPAMDVTLSELVQFLTKEGKGDKVAHVYHNHRLVAILQPSRR